MTRGRESGFGKIRIGELSELLVLSVLERLNSASVPAIFESLAIATKNGKAPFFIGPSLEQVLEWRQRRNEVTHRERGRIILYSVTVEGKKTVDEFAPLVRRYFPNLSKVSGVVQGARRLAAR